MFMMAIIETGLYLGLATLVVGLVGGSYMFHFQHAKDKKLHPDAGDVVYKDTCKKTQDCIEGEIRGMKELMNQRFDTLEKMITGNKK